MSYNPTQGIFVNGRVADANELLNELGAISGAIKEVDDKVVSADVEVTKEAKAYTDSELAALAIDGGTF